MFPFLLNLSLIRLLSIILTGGRYDAGIFDWNGDAHPCLTIVCFGVIDILLFDEIKIENSKYHWDKILGHYQYLKIIYIYIYIYYNYYNIYIIYIL